MGKQVRKQDVFHKQSSARALVCALKHRDIYTQMHSQRVVEWSAELGRMCGLAAKDVSRLRCSAGLHDIGKIGIPDEILLKPGALDASEWEVMKTHAQKGEDIVRNLDFDEPDEVARAVRHHHEKLDGTGYPDGLKNEHIPVFSRIIAITDSFDAMADTRPYHQSRSLVDIMDIMHGEQGKFDPWLLNKFETLIKKNRLAD